MSAERSSEITPLGMLAALLQGGEVPEGIPWTEVLGLAWRHGALPLLFWTLRERGGGQDRVPAGVYASLEAAYYAEAGHAMTRNRALAQVVTALHRAGVPALLLKGSALARTVYPDVLLRIMSDLDILIPREHREQARQVLEAIGCAYEPEPPGRFNPFNTEFTGNTAFHCPVGNQQVCVEIHWEVLPVGLFRRTTACRVESFWERALPLRAEDVSALTLAPEDLLANVCVHLSMHGFVHLLAYIDIMLLVRSGQVDWNPFIERVRQDRLRGACYYPLWWAATAWSVPVPDEVLRALRPDPLRVGVGRWLTARGLKRSPNSGHALNHVAQLVAVDRLWDVFLLLAWLLFPGPAWLRERYRLRRGWQGWLWMAVHPLVVAREGVLSLGALAGQVVRATGPARKGQGVTRGEERA